MTKQKPDVFLDTNIFIASLIDEPGRGDEATDLMNQDMEFVTSVLNLMELRTVLTKKKRVEQTEAEEIISDIRNRVSVYEVDRGVTIRAVEVQKEHLIYPMDALILASAQQLNIDLATFDSELIKAGAKPPLDVLNVFDV